MRVAKGFLASAVVLFVAGATGALPAWAMPVSGLVLFVGAVAAAIAMEEHDFAGVAGLAPDRRSAALPADPAVRTAA